MQIVRSLQVGETTSQNCNRVSRWAFFNGEINYLWILVTIAVFLMLTGCDQTGGELSDAASTSVRAQSDGFVPVTDERLIKAHDEPENWLMFRRTLDQWGYSPLEQINRDNVHDLQLVWSRGMNSGRNQQETLVVDGIMFLIHPQSEVEALDARSGEPIWSFQDEPPADVRNRGRSRSLAVYQDKVIFGTGDTRVIALEARSGRKIWEVDTLPSNPSPGGHDFSAGPIAVNGKVFIGNACTAGPLLPCYVAGIDVETGKVLWKREAIAGPADPAEAQASWGAVAYENRHKASFWVTGSYDPKLNLTYWGSASASPYPEILKGTGEGNLLWTNSTLAIRADTGELAWAFQHHPRDNWDADYMGERMYVDGLRVQPDSNELKWYNPDLLDGQVRNVLWAIGKPGVLWALDRETGEFLWAKETVYQEYYKDIDKEGHATLADAKIPKKVGDEIRICPGIRGGSLWQNASYSPLTNALYLSVHQTCSLLRIVATDSGLDWTKLLHMPESEGNTGRLIAVEASTGKLLWSYQQRAPMWSTLTTGGGLVFVGDNYRNLMVFDQRTGDKVWEIGLSGPVMGNAISFALDGRQYIAVTVGGGGAGGPHINRELTPELEPRVGSNVLLVFALPKGP